MDTPLPEPEQTSTQTPSERLWTANDIMDRILAKMREVGFDRFTLGLPGNLVLVKRGDYVDHEGPPEEHGVPQLDDGSDGFQFYENGGTSGCWVYYTLKALYQLGRVDDARRIFFPMLEGYTNGGFQGFGENGMSRDWRDWGRRLPRLRGPAGGQLPHPARRARRRADTMIEPSNGNWGSAQ